MRDIVTFSELIGSIYEAASGRAPFQQLGAIIANAFDSQSCALQVRNSFSGPVARISFTDNYTPEATSRYKAYYYLHDIWANVAMNRPPGMALGSDDIIDDADFRESLIYREFSRNLGLFYMVGCTIPLDGPNNALGVLGVHRTEREGMFTEEDKHYVGLLRPHLKRALQLREKFATAEMQNQAAFQALEMLTVGVLLVDENMRVLLANYAAEETLRQGTALREKSGRLYSVSPNGNSALARFVSGATKATIDHSSLPGGMLRLPRAEQNPLSLSIYPFIAASLLNGESVRAALIFLSDPDITKAPDRASLAQMYGVTPAEAKLFEAILAGERLQDYAERNSVSVQTVKTQLGKLFDKTGHARQTDLVRDALSNPLLSLRR
jgi:DNA-binding CsgD family transcriptional regulator